MRQIIILYLLIVGSSVIAFGQSDYDEKTLLKQLDTAVSNYSKYTIYDKLVRSTNDFELAYNYAKKSLILAKKINNPELIAAAYYKMAISHYQAMNLSEALIDYENAYAAYEQLKDTAYLAKISYFQGKTNYLLGKNKKALEHYFIKVDWEKKINNIKGLNAAFLAIAYSYAELEDFELALEYGQDAYKLEKENGLDISYSLDIIGGIYQQMGDYVQAKKYYTLSLKNTQDEHTSMNYGIGLSNIGNIYMTTGQYDSAMYYFFDFLKIAEQNEEEYYEAIAHNQIAEVQLELSAFEEAEKNATIAMKYNKEKGIKVDYLVSLDIVAKSLLEQQKYRQSEKIIKEGLEVLKTAESKTYYITFYNLYGKLKTLENDFSTALSYHEKALSYAKELDKKNDIGTTYYYLANTESKLKNFDKAIELATQSLFFIKKVNYRHFLNDVYKLLAELTAVNKDYQAAYEYQLLFQNLQDSMLNNEKNKYLVKYHKAFQVDKKEAENEVLKDKNNQSQIIIKQRTLLGLGLGLGLVVLLSIASWLFYNNRRKQRYNIRLENEVNKRTVELKEANKNLEQANYELRTFNYIASHDIKEPIRVIGGHVGLIKRKLPKDLQEKLSEYFDMIKRSTKQLYTLIEDFANYTTMSKGEVIERQNVDLNLLTIGVVEQLEETVRKYKGEVLIKDLPTIKTDNSLLFTTLKNLIENGLKYNNSEIPTVNVSYNKTETQHEIILTDNGIGIEETYHEKIFEMFKRLHSRAEYEGSGIGLAIVKLSVDKLAGTINVESEVGKGSRFVIRLPI